MRQLEDILSPNPSFARGGIVMSTYEEFMVLLAAGMLIVAIIKLKK